jgi:3-oxoacyl-[acyl-carrier-protein] synthase-3
MTSELRESKDIELQSNRSRMGKLMGVQIVGTGSNVPDNIVKNEDLASLGYDADWIIKRTGIMERRHAPPGMATSDMAIEAARRAIKDADVDPADIDLLLLGTYTPDYLLPTSACLVQAALGLKAPAVDMHAACASFIYCLVTGMQFIATGCSKLALIIGADCNSRVVNPADKKTFPLFGDAAGAALLASGSDQQGLVSFAMGADGDGANLLYREVGGTKNPYTPEAVAEGSHYLTMQGRSVFKWAIRLLSETICDSLESADLTLDDVDLVIFHQANMRIISSAVKDLGIDPKKVFNNLDRYGNTSAGSIPLALDEAFRQGRIQPGNLVLFSGFGAGLAWGTVLMRW